jgi:hypothetical protein
MGPYPTTLTVVGLVAILGVSTAAEAQQSALPVELQAEYAVLPLPVDMREGAKVIVYGADGEPLTLREGTNGLVCVADKPGDEDYSGVCYHESLEPFLERGRQLRSEGVESGEVLVIRHEEMDNGTLPLPEQGATLYNMTMKLEDFDAETATPVLYAIYTPYATSESTGLPKKPEAPGAPWIMRGGTASSHIMIVVPR